MRLIIFTQIVDKQHGVLGFFHRWLEEFAQHCDHVHVVALQVGDYSLPENITVHTLGKETGVSRLKYLRRFINLTWSLRHEYDTVFVHMNQVYVLLGGLFWRLTGKKIGLWYVHRQVTLSLRVAVWLVHRVFSSAPASMRVPTKKVEFVGHGIDVNKFPRKQVSPRTGPLQLAHIGRLTQIKNIEILIEAVHRLSDPHAVLVRLYGDAGLAADHDYVAMLKEKVETYDLTEVVTFCGAVPYDTIIKTMPEFDLTVNMTPTGGMDKAVIESAASGVLVCTANEAFAEFMGDYAKQLLVLYRDPQALATAIEFVASHTPDQYKAASTYFRQQSLSFDVTQLIPCMLRSLRSL